MSDQGCLLDHNSSHLLQCWCDIDVVFVLGLPQRLILRHRSPSRSCSGTEGIFQACRGSNTSHARQSGDVEARGQRGGPGVFFQSRDETLAEVNVALGGVGWKSTAARARYVELALVDGSAV